MPLYKTENIEVVILSGDTEIEYSYTLQHEGEVLAVGANPVELAANVKAALTSARAQGAADALARIIAEAEKGNSIDDIVVMHWLRSNTGED